MTITESFKKDGPWKNCTVDLVVPFYNEEKNVRKTHQSNKQLENLFNINSFVYVDNGSGDQTLSLLNDLAREDKKVKVVIVKNNTGYGNGMRQGIYNTTGDFILTNHADMQFDSYEFFLRHLSTLSGIENPCSVFPYRTNRSLAERFFSAVLRMILSIFQLRRINDFNGQPKLFPRSYSKEIIDEFPNDFSFDLALYMYFYGKNSIRLPVFQKERLEGISSWNISPFARFRQIRNWLVAGFRLAYLNRYSALREYQRKNNLLRGNS